MLLKRRMLMDLAEQKLGKNATIRVTREGWVAESPGGKRVTGKTRDVLEWRLRGLSDVVEPQKESVG